MTRKLRFGIIACGVIGRLHAEAITSIPDAQLVAVADIIPELAQKLAEAFHATSYNDVRLTPTGR
jgi:UDP-N-acetyl-2-amino-2-deoxyglucuronate dehydrogenase